MTFTSSYPKRVLNPELPSPVRRVDECHELICRPGSLLEMEHVTIRGIKQRVWKNLPKTVRSLFAKVTEEYASRDYLVYENDRLTFGQARTFACTLADVMVRKLGLQIGDRVGIAGRNISEWVCVFWAVHIAGGKYLMGHGLSCSE